MCIKRWLEDVIIAYFDWVSLSQSCLNILPSTNANGPTGGLSVKGLLTTIND